jgi:hypothetical protein
MWASVWLRPRIPAGNRLSKPKEREVNESNSSEQEASGNAESQQAQQQEQSKPAEEQGNDSTGTKEAPSGD